VHIAQIGTGRVGRPTAYSIMCAELADTITLCDIKPGLAAAFAEELKHVTASTGLDVKVNSCEKDEEVAGADIILCTGKNFRRLAHHRPRGAIRSRAVQHPHRLQPLVRPGLFSPQTPSTTPDVTLPVGSISRHLKVLSFHRRRRPYLHSRPFRH
jgi:hypothetical protein